jgi:large subunit ribosomal protein L21
MDFAIIKTGGKQYKVSSGQKIKIEKLEIAENKEVVFDEVLLVEKDGETKIGAPLVKGAKVVGKVLAQGRSKKVTIRKYKPKKRYDVKRGHRQPYTEVEITDIK